MANPNDLADRRAFLGGAAAVGAALALPVRANGASRAQVPNGFRWGVSTAGHQIEGNNVNSDTWLAESVRPTLYKERSGDACDSYHRYEEDIELLAALGFNSYRFSIEWSRIEPLPGQFSLAELDHYKQMIEACHKHGVLPCVTFNHYTAPIWFATSGSFLQQDGPAIFARYCDRAARHLADGMGYAFTLNEPEANRILRYLLPVLAPGVNFKSIIASMAEAAAKARGANQFENWNTWDPDISLHPLIEAHKQGRAAIKAVRTELPVGATLAVFDYQADGPHSIVDRVRTDIDGAWFEAVRQDDFVGVQTYSRQLVGEAGLVPAPKGAELTGGGMEFYPTAIGNAVRAVHHATGRPILVTENGISTHDDTQRVRYIDGALASLRDAMADGVPLLGYFHWSLLDNFEWFSGYDPTFGLVAVDRTTFKRTPKPSAAYLGAIARANRI